MLILPVSSEPNGAPGARQLLQQVADQRTHCTMVVFNDGPRPREIASRADVRAGNDPFREVVWIPDVAVLQGVPAFEALLDRCKAGYEAVALTIRFEISSCLKGADATSFYKLELAFASALAGVAEP